MYDDLYSTFLEEPELLEAKVAEDLAITPGADLDGYLRTQAERYFYWAALASIAESRASKQKHRVQEELWAMARTKARLDAESRSQKVTEGRLDEVASLDNEFREGRDLLCELEAISGIFRGAERAMYQRLEMLRSLNSRQRVELNNIPDDDFIAKASRAISTKRRKAATTD